MYNILLLVEKKDIGIKGNGGDKKEKYPWDFLMFLEVAFVTQKEGLEAFFFPLYFKLWPQSSHPF